MTLRSLRLTWLPLFVAVLAFRSDGAPVSFGTPVNYPTQKAPLMMVTGDFNGDGKLDLAIADGGSSSVTVMIGNGEGTFQTPASYSTGTNCAVNYVATGDFNNDGHTDLLTGCLLGTTLAVLPGKGDGTFGAPVVTQLSLNMLTGQSLEGGTLSSGIADFDGDGTLDIVMLLGNAANSNFNGIAAYLLKGRGDGSFQAPQAIIAFTGLETISFAAGDFNADGHADLAVLVVNSGFQSGNLIVAFGNGDGTFKVANTYPTQFGLGLTVGDVNGDGFPDIILSGGALGSNLPEIAAGFDVLLGNGHGGFQPAGTYTGTSGSLIISLCLANLQGNGKTDIVAVEWTGLANGSTQSAEGNLLWFAGNGDGTFQNAVPLTTPSGTAASSIVSGDFNGDGRIDLAYPTLTISAIPTLSGNGFGSLDQDLLAALAALPNGSADVLLNTTPPSTFTDVNAAGFQPGSMAQDSIVTAFGIGLASTTATTTMLGTTLGGVTINVKDSTGNSRPADLFYVSPTQINYAIPAGTATGQAQITIANGSSTVTIQQPIAAVLPGIFAASGFAAANVETFQNGQLLSATLATQVAADGTITALPINVTTGQVFLLLYGTGIRHATSVTVNIGTQTGLPVAFAGAQGFFVGEDQINVALPATLQGAGLIDVTLTADGQTSNPVKIDIQ